MLAETEGNASFLQQQWVGGGNLKFIAETVRGAIASEAMRGTYSCVTRLDWPVVSQVTP